jgi:predicted permease
VQIASSVVLLVSAGLLLRSFVRLEAVRPGFEPSNVLAMKVALMPASFPTPGSIAVFHAELRRQLGELPGVQSVGAISILPMSGGLARTDFTIDGRPPTTPENTPSANYRVAGPGYFAAMKIPVIAGRDFSESDTERTRRVAIVNRALAGRFFAESSATGAHLRMEGFGGGEMEIVGVVEDVKQAGLSDGPGLDLYLPYAQTSQASVALLRNNMYWVIRTAGEPLKLASAARRTIYGMKKDVAIVSGKSLDQYLAATVASRRFDLVLLAVFAASAMLLAVIAVYGIVSYGVARRTREIGLRIALGAQRPNVIALVMGRGLRLTFAGVGTGLAGALLTARFLSNMLYETEAFDMLTFIGAAGLLVGAALVASYLPARRAMRLDPLAALRQE